MLMHRPLLTLFAVGLLAACAQQAPQPQPEAAICRSADGEPLRPSPAVGSSTGLPTPRDLYTSRAATFRSGPTLEDAALFRLEQPAPVTILRECGTYRLARVEDGRAGWVHRSLLTIKPPTEAADAPTGQRKAS